MTLGNCPNISVFYSLLVKDNDNQLNKFIGWPEELLSEKYIMAIFVFPHLNGSSPWLSVLSTLHGALKPSEQGLWNAFSKKLISHQGSRRIRLVWCLYQVSTDEAYSTTENKNDSE